MKKAYKAHIHLHTTFGALASIESHAEMAQRIGIDALFITDHDVRMGLLEHRINDLYYDTPELMAKQMVDDKVIGEFGWRQGSSGTVDICEPPASYQEHPYALRIKAAPYSTCDATLESTGKRHQASLLADLTLKMAFFLPEINMITQGICVCILLSQRPGDHVQRKLCYVAGNCQIENDAYVLPFSLTPGSWQESLFQISKDMQQLDTFGKDNCFYTVQIKLYNYGHESFVLYHGGFSLSRRFTAQQARIEQQKLAEKIADHYGIKIYACTEISDAGINHLNSFSPQVPVIDYQKYDYKVSTEFAINHLNRYKGVYSLNHIFAPWKRSNLHEGDHERVIKELIETLTKNKCEGAQLIEVGFPQGRHGFSIEEHTRVWDALALRGIFLTGVGCSDSHDSRTGWLDGNNFAVYIQADELTKEALLDAMIRGMLYCADPMIWHGNFDFYIDGVSMGFAFRCEKGSSYRAQIRLSFLGEQLLLRVQSHNTLLLETPIHSGDNQIDVEVPVQKPVEAVRVMLYDKNGRCCLLSNPVYLISDPAIDIPEIRYRKPNSTVK